MDARRLPGGADAGDRVHGGGDQGRRVRVLLRFFEVALGPAVGDWQPALAALAAVSIVVGNVGALGQSLAEAAAGLLGGRAGRLHAGRCGRRQRVGVKALVFYLAAYALMNLAAFA